MKLYTEEQVKMMLARAKLYRGAVYDNFEFIMSDNEVLNYESPIKLPSIDEIRNECNVDNLNTNQQYLFELGGTWVCDEIQKRSKKLNTITNIQAQIISNNKQSSVKFELKEYVSEKLISIAFSLMPKSNIKNKLSHFILETYGGKR